MLNDDEVKAQQELLATHRRTLATLLKQHALHGPANVPTAIVAGIEEARGEISHIKATLRAQHVSVEDHPDDNDHPQATPRATIQGIPHAGGIQIGSGMQGGTIHVGHHAQIAEKIVNTNVHSNLRLSRLWIVLGFGIIALVIAGVGFLVIRPFLPAGPMPDGGWNVALAAVAWDNGYGTARVDSQTDNLSARIYPIIESRVESDRSRRVSALTGDSTERARQAAVVASRTKASVVVYGVLRPTTPGVGQFQPEFYISPDIRNAAASVSEIVGTSQFGMPVEVTLNTTRNADEDAIGRRVSALEFVLNGVNQYVAERYDPARSELESALKALGSEEDGQAAAVIHEFMAANELGAKRYDQALNEVDRAHHLWAAYARPYLTRASIRYTQANTLLQNNDKTITIRLPQTMPLCFDNLPGENQDIGWYLAQALACYDESLHAPDQPPDIELADKVAYSRANIYVTLSFYGGGAHWNDALPLLEQVISHYQAAQTDEERQRLRRIAAHAYARRGLIRFSVPGQTPESRTAALSDYQMAVDLLERPDPSGESCHDKPDTCYKSDRPFIEVYSRQLQQLKSTVEPSP